MLAGRSVKLGRPVSSGTEGPLERDALVQRQIRQSNRRLSVPAVVRPENREQDGVRRERGEQAVDIAQPQGVKSNPNGSLLARKDDDASRTYNSIRLTIASR